MKTTELIKEIKDEDKIKEILETILKSKFTWIENRSDYLNSNFSVKTDYVDFTITENNDEDNLSLISESIIINNELTITEYHKNSNHLPMVKNQKPRPEIAKLFRDIKLAIRHNKPEWFEIL